MIKYATAIRLGTATTEAILRRFAKDVTHPAYAAMIEVGKVGGWWCGIVGGEGARIVVVAGLRIDAVTREPLGRQGLAEVTDRLWTKDCRSCHRPLADGRQAPALAVDDMGEGRRGLMRGVT